MCNRRRVGKFFIFVSAMLLWLISDFLVLWADVPDVCSTASVSLIAVIINVLIGADVVLQHPPLYFIDEIILLYAPHFDTQRSAMMPIDQTINERRLMWVEGSVETLGKLSPCGWLRA